MTDNKHCSCPCPHQWIQPVPFVPTWVRETPSPKVCPQQHNLVTPNPVIPTSATLQICTPLEVKKTGPNTAVVTVSIPAESIITLPSKALEIKMIRKHLKITQCRFFNNVSSSCGIPSDTPKLFLGGFIRKDILYSEAVRQSVNAVEGVIKDYIVDIPFSCVVDLGKHLIFPPVHYDQQHEYGMLSSDLSEFNLVSQNYYNTLPSCQLLFSQINEMDDALDRVPLYGGPFEEGVFKTLQEKMVILIKLQLTFPFRGHGEKHCKNHKPKKDK